MAGLIGFLKDQYADLKGTELEKQVRKTMTNDNWPVTNTAKAEIAQQARSYQGCREVMPIVWERLNSPPKMWRVIVKALELLEVMIRLSSERVCDEARENQRSISSLIDFRFSEDGRDRGAGIREKSKHIVDLLNDRDKLNDVRNQARINQTKCVAVSSDGSHRSSMDHVSYNEDRYESAFSGNNSSSYDTPAPKPAASAPAHKPKKKAPPKAVTDSDTDEGSEEETKKKAKPAKKATKKVAVQIEGPAAEAAPAPAKHKKKAVAEPAPAAVAPVPVQPQPQPQRQAPAPAAASSDFDWSGFSSGPASTASVPVAVAPASTFEPFDPRGVPAPKPAVVAPVQSAPTEWDPFTSAPAAAPAKPAMQMPVNFFDAPRPAPTATANATAASNPDIDFGDFKSAEAAKPAKKADALWGSSLVGGDTFSLTSAPTAAKPTGPASAKPSMSAMRAATGPTATAPTNGANDFFFNPANNASANLAFGVPMQPMQQPMQPMMPMQPMHAPYGYPQQNAMGMGMPMGMGMGMAPNGFGQYPAQPAPQQPSANPLSMFM